MQSVLWAVIACGIIAVLYGVVTASRVMASDAGTPRMQEIAQAIFGHRAHGVQPEQLEARHAEMNAFDRPIVKTGHSERAPVANPLAQDFPRVG